MSEKTKIKATIAVAWKYCARFLVFLTDAESQEEKELEQALSDASTIGFEFSSLKNLSPGVYSVTYDGDITDPKKIHYFPDILPYGIIDAKTTNALASESGNYISRIVEDFLSQLVKIRMIKKFRHADQRIVALVEWIIHNLSLLPGADKFSKETEISGFVPKELMQEPVNDKNKLSLFTGDEMVMVMELLREVIKVKVLVPYEAVRSEKDKFKIETNYYVAQKGTPEHAAWEKIAAAGFASALDGGATGPSQTEFKVSSKGMDLLGIRNGR